MDREETQSAGDEAAATLPPRATLWFRASHFWASVSVSLSSQDLHCTTRNRHDFLIEKRNAASLICLHTHTLRSVTRTTNHRRVRDHTKKASNFRFRNRAR